MDPGNRISTYHRCCTWPLIVNDQRYRNCGHGNHGCGTTLAVVPIAIGSAAAFNVFRKSLTTPERKSPCFILTASPLPPTMPLKMIAMYRQAYWATRSFLKLPCWLVSIVTASAARPGTECRASRHPGGLTCDQRGHPLGLPCPRQLV